MVLQLYATQLYSYLVLREYLFFEKKLLFCWFVVFSRRHLLGQSARDDEMTR